MQPGTIHDDEVSLTELGYDIIGTDGESQAESTTSSIDYQRADDVQSLMGTDTGTDVDTNDVDTDSSDEEEEVPLNDGPLTPDHDIVAEEEADEDEDAGVESLADQSLENPTNFEQYGIPKVHILTVSQQSPARDLTGDMENADSLSNDKASNDEVVTQPELTFGGKSSHAVKPYIDSAKHMCRATLEYVKQHRHILIYHTLMLSGLAILSGGFMVGKHYLNPPPPRVLSTVPVAAVSSAAMPSPSDVASVLTPLNTPVVATTAMPNALQTGAAFSSLSLKYPGKEKIESPGTSSAPRQTICSAELFSRNEIIVRIPQNIKSSWLAKDAIMIAVSRGIYDIPTKVSSVEEGFLIQVPPHDAHGIFDVSIATTRSPKINEVFRVNFSRYALTEALDAGKQLVRDFAQRVVDTVNETTAWVEETYIPAFDVVSRQVCGQTASVTDSILKTVKDAGVVALGIPTRAFTQVAEQIRPSLNGDVLAQRANQAHLELTRQAQDLRDELALGLLTAQLNSKLWWLKVQGKKDEHQHYMNNAAAYYKQKQADALDARRERAVRVMKEIRTRWKQERQSTRTPFWKKAAGGS